MALGQDEKIMSLLKITIALSLAFLDLLADCGVSLFDFSVTQQKIVHIVNELHQHASLSKPRSFFLFPLAERCEDKAGTSTCKWRVQNGHQCSVAYMKYECFKTCVCGRLSLLNFYCATTICLKTTRVASKGSLLNLFFLYAISTFPMQATLTSETNVFLYI